MRYIHPLKWMQVRSILIAGACAVLFAPLSIILLTPHHAVLALIPLGIIIVFTTIFYLEDCSHYTEGRGQFAE